jgi:uncharacterized protein involved in outer membrane biogenesis
MTTENEAGQTSQGSRWFRKLAIILGAVLGLLVITYFVVTSTMFVKGVILPRVGRALNAEVTVQDASISPFSRVTLRNLVVKTTGSEPLLKAEQVHARYDLIAILRGTIRVHEVAVVSPEVRIVQQPDGQSNLDPISAAARHLDRSTDTIQFDLQNVSLKTAMS